MDRILLSRYTPAGVVVDDDMEIIQFRGSTGAYLEPAPGKASLNIIKMAKDGLAFELRSAILKVQKSGRAFKKSGIILHSGAGAATVQVEVLPVKNAGSDRHYLVLFETEPKTAADSSGQQPSGHPKLKVKDRRIKQLEQELTQMREDMRSVTEDQEASNEELQTANEEVLSSNEELQSINEELETSKEELEATNEELTTVNDELQNSNQQLDESRNYTEAIIRTITMPLLVLDKDLRAKTTNRAFCQAFEVTEEATIGTLLYSLGNGQWDIPELRRLLGEVLPQNESFNDYEITHNFPSIGRKVMLLNARKFEQFGENILLAIEDITERNQEQDERVKLERKNAALAEKQVQLEATSSAKDEFISLASHQLRTPATAVKQYTGMLLEGYMGELSDKQRSALSSAYESNDRQLKIVDDLLRVARVDQGRVKLAKSRCDLAELLRTVIAEQAATFEKRGQTIQFTPPRQKVTAQADQKLMRMALENILDNASKYSGSGKPVEATLARTKNRAVISIKDRGVGISKKDQKSLFEKFARFDNDYSVVFGGSGLGLYWAKHIVELHDGAIDVDSKKGSGSTFTVTIPVSAQR